jgi:hypothetical protein
MPPGLQVEAMFDVWRSVEPVTLLIKNQGAAPTRAQMFFAFLPRTPEGLSRRMKPIIVSLALVCAAAGARADLVLQQQITIATNNSVATLNVKGTKVRLDLYAGQPQAVSTIKDLKTGDTITLFHKQKMFVKTPGGMPRQTQPAGNGITANPAPKAPLPRATGQNQKVGSYDTELYTWSNSRGITGTAWVVKNFPDYNRIRADYAMLDKSPDGADTSMTPALSALPGMVVRSQVTGDGQTITLALISAKEGPLDASLFGIPRDYKEVPQPKPLKPVITQSTPPKASGSSTPKAPGTSTKTSNPKAPAW